MSRRDTAFALFCQGKTPSSPEIKALGLAPDTRYNYLTSWRNLGKPDHYPHVSRTQRKKEQKKGGVAKPTMLEGGESVGGYEEPSVEDIADEIPKIESKTPETEAKREPELETQETEASVATSELPVKPKYGDDHKELTAIPEEVVGAGLRIEVTVSLKTLAFFEIVHTIDPHLSLGDFIDDCVVDFFRGRGKDFGLLEIKEVAK